MKCNKIEDLLALYVDNVLEQNLKEKVEIHLAECQKCRTLAEDMKKMLSLSGTMYETQVPVNLITKINTRIETSKPKNYFVPVPYLAHTVVAIFILGFAGYYFTLNKETKNNTQQQITAKKVEIPQEELVTITSIKKIGESKIKEEQKISEKTIEIAKLPEQTQNKEIVFRGGKTVKNKKFILEWKGFSEIKENNKYLIINSSEDWKNVWLKHLKGAVPEINFKKDVIIATFSEANELQITEIKESNDKYYIKIKEILGKEEKSETVTGNPFHIVVLKK